MSENVFFGHGRCELCGHPHPIGYDCQAAADKQSLLQAVSEAKPTASAMTPAQLAAIRERVEKATPEPWTMGNNRVGYVFSLSPDADCVVAICGDFADEELVRFNGDRWNADATFIAAARRDVPDLLDEVDRLRACLAMIAGTIEEEGDGTTLAKCQAVAIGALEGQ